MANRVFNDADKFLLERWKEAKDLADAMKTVRKKCRDAFTKIGKEESELYESLDVFEEYFTQNWATGSLVFGRSHKAWAAVHNDEPNGLWLDNLHLDYLTSEEEKGPSAYVWVRPARKAGIDVAAAKEKLWNELLSLFGSNERSRFKKWESDQDTLIGWEFSSRQEIVGWLLAEEMQKLAECIHEQGAMFARLVPVLDALLRPVLT